MKLFIKQLFILSLAFLNACGLSTGGGSSGGNPLIRPFVSPTLGYVVRVEAPLAVKMNDFKHTFVYAGYEVTIERITEPSIPCGSKLQDKVICDNSNNPNVYDVIISLFGSKYFRITSDGKVLNPDIINNVKLTFVLSLQPLYTE